MEEPYKGTRVKFAQCMWCHSVYTCVVGLKGARGNTCSGDCYVMFSLEFNKRKQLREKRRRRYINVMQSIEEQKHESDDSHEDPDEDSDGFTKVDERHISPVKGCLKRQANKGVNDDHECTPMAFERVPVPEEKTRTSNLRKYDFD